MTLNTWDNTLTYSQLEVLTKLKSIQSGASSRSKIGGAYFLDVTGSIQDPIAVPGRLSVPVTHG